MVQNAMASTLTLAWGLAAAPQRGPKRELSLERIVEAAIGIADAEGLTAVTMQRVASVFEFSTMALYRYVATKEDLHQLMFDTAMGAPIAPATSRSTSRSTPIPTPDWRTRLQDLLRCLTHAYRTHPWTLDIRLAPDMHLMPGQMRFADTCLHAMRDLPVVAETKLGVLMLMSAFARGQATVEREVLHGTTASPATRMLIQEAASTSMFPDLAPLLANGAYFGDHPSDAAQPPLSAEAEADAMLDFAANVLTAGLEKALGQVSSATVASADGDPVATVSVDPVASAGVDPVATVSIDPVERETPYADAEARLRRHRKLRKQVQKELGELKQEEKALQEARDHAKVLA